MKYYFQKKQSTKKKSKKRQPRQTLYDNSYWRSEEELLREQNENIQSTLLVALRMLEERKKIWTKIEDPVNHYNKKFKRLKFTSAA